MGRAGILLVALLASTAAAGADVLIQSFSFVPDAPDTGDPIRLSAVIQSTSSCNFIGTRMTFGPQAELGGRNGWGVDVDFQDGGLPGASTCPIEADLGALPPADADGVLRARDNGVVDDLRTFHLTIEPGPVPGFAEPVLHGGFELLLQSSAMTALPGRLAVSDLLNRRIRFLDPRTGDLLSQINAPGTGDVRGLAWDGSALYAAVRDAAGPRIYRLDLLGRILDAFASPVITPGSAPLEGLAFRDGVLYGSYESPPTLFAIDPATHAKLWSRPLPGRIRALDAAPEGLLGADASGSFYFIEARATGADVLLADVIDTGHTAFTDFTGLAYDGSGMVAWDAVSGTMMSMRTFGLWWGSSGSLLTYVPGPGTAVDVLRGDLQDSAPTSNVFDLAWSAPAVCLVSRGAGGPVLDPQAPPEGHAFFYVARVIDASGSPASYGRTSGGMRRVDSREACP